jgi:hypothetical protein
MIHEEPLEHFSLKIIQHIQMLCKFMIILFNCFSETGDKKAILILINKYEKDIKREKFHLLLIFHYFCNYTLIL